MFPAKAWDIYQRKTLEEYLDDLATQCVNLEMELLKLGQDKQTAKEVVFYYMMPPDQEPPEAPMLEDQEQTILAWAKNLGTPTH